MGFRRSWVRIPPARFRAIRLICEATSATEYAANGRSEFLQVCCGGMIAEITEANVHRTTEPARKSHQVRTRTEDFLIVGLILGDALVFLASQLMAYWVRFVSGWSEKLPAFIEVTDPDILPTLAEYQAHFLLGTILFLLAGAYFGIFGRDSFVRPRWIIGEVVKTCLAWLLFYLLLSLVFRISPPISRLFVFFTMLLSTGFVLGWRALYGRFVRESGLIEALRKRILVVGWTKESVHLSKRISSVSRGPYSLAVAVPSAVGGFQIKPPTDVPILGDYDDVPALLESGQYDILLLADLNPSVEETSGLINLCHKEMVNFMAIPAFFEVLVSGLHLESLYGVPTITIGRLPLDFLSARMIKRCVDVVGACIGLFLSAPIIAVFGYLVYRESPGAIFYSQIRSGRKGAPFRMYKIRSMRLDAEATTGARWAVPEDSRRLKIGTFMRRWNIDELPQFWNVLKGEMSLVGPRPERPELISAFKHSIPNYNIRLTVKPGLTGWAQVHGLRGDTDLSERIRFDIDYIERWSPPMDFYVMLLTLLRNKNAY
jgi:exopolysaccharide biosynthesis polyprenyl glycosylphosphotransferase